MNNTRVFLPQEIIDKILIDTKDLKLALQLGNEYYIRKIYDPKIHTIDEASRNGVLKMVKIIHSFGGKFTFNALNWASLNGHFEIFEYLKGLQSELYEYDNYR